MLTNIETLSIAGAPAGESLESLFWPESVAIVGASPDITRVRGEILHLLDQMGYEGRIYPVNGSYQEIAGRKCYAKLADIGAAVDLVIIAIPAAAVVGALEEAIAAGARNVLIVSSGFAEAGPEAARAQERIAGLARQSGIRIVGPNSEGFYNALGKVAATFSPAVRPSAAEGRPVSRRVGVIAQSGGIGFALYSRGLAAGLEFSYVISTGNETDLTMSDLLSYMVDDPRTDMVMIFCEAIRDPQQFLAAAARARQAGKPVIAIKIGASQAASRAAASHTASMTGWQDAYAAAFHRHGVLQAEDPETAVAIAGMLSTMPPVTGRRVGVVTVSGGGGAWMSDALEAAGFDVPLLSPELQKTLSAYMPAHGSACNPVDITAQGANTGPMATSAIEALETSDEVDLIVYVCSLASQKRISLAAGRAAGVIARQKKPLALWGYTLASDYGRQVLSQSGVFGSTELSSFAKALSRVVEYWTGQQGRADLTVPQIASLALPDGSPNVLSEYRTRQLLDAHGVLPGEGHLVQTEDEAASAAGAIGYPVVLKVQSPDIPHKTEAGALRIRLADEAAVRAAWGAILASARTYAPDAVIEGVLVQKMAPSGIELIVGMVDDPTFGPVMMLGAGGVLAELLTDTVHRLAPVSRDEALAMISELRSARLFEGWRGGDSIDPGPVADFVAGVSQLAASRDRAVREMEFNPVIAHSGGISVVDGLVMLHDRTKGA